jgi:hypothetical protein
MQRSIAARWSAPVLLAVVAAAPARAQVPAAYKAPPPGTVYHYRGATNRIVSTDGWRVTYVDHLGRTGARIGTFLVEDPTRPVRVERGGLERFWPLRRGTETSFRIVQDPLAWRWHGRVTDTATVRVPAGRFFTYVVQTVQESEIARKGEATTVMNVFWYAPALDAVVRYRTTYLSGPAAGRRVTDELVRVEAPSSGASQVGARPTASR